MRPQYIDIRRAPALLLIVVLLGLCGCYNVIMLNVGANHSVLLQRALPPSEMCGAATLASVGKRTRTQVEMELALCEKALKATQKGAQP